MKSLRVFVTRRIFPEAVDLLSAVAQVEVWPDDEPPTPAQLLENVEGVHGLLTNVMDRVDGELLDAATELKAISQLSVGLDNVDLVAATRRGLPVSNTPGVLAKSTADLGFGLLLDAARLISRGDRWVRAGHWQLAHHPMHWLGSEVHGATLGILGMGQIGLEMAKRGMGFDMKVIYHSRTRKPELDAEYGMEYVERDMLLSSADFVCLHLPLTAQTRHYIGETELRAMKPTAVLVNMARGPVVDSKALYTALNEGWIQAAGLDVTDPEPIPVDDPLLTLDNLIISPHIGSASLDTRRATCLMAARDLVAGLQGEAMEHCANPEVYQA